MPVPLQQNRVLNTRSIDAAREVVSRFYCDHDLVPLGNNRPLGFHAVHNHVPIRTMSVNYMTYTSRVLVDPGYLQDFFLLQLPLEGAAEIRTGGRVFDSDRRVASVISPTEHTSMVWSDRCAKLLVQIARDAMEQELSRLIQTEISTPLVFDPVMPLDSNGRACSWWRFVQCLVADLDSGTFQSLGGAECRAMESMLMTNLLHALPHNYTPVIEGCHGGIAPRQVKRAEAHMQQNVCEPVTIADLVQVTGVSARSLFEAFKRFRGVTPMKRFAQMRLERVRTDLLNAKDGETVTEILNRCGVTQMGRFAAHYRKIYGETPSQTLRQ